MDGIPDMTIEGTNERVQLEICFIFLELYTGV